MGFLDFSRQKMRLARLRKQLEAEPRPHALAELARSYLALGERELAEEVLQLAERCFPDSDSVRRVRSGLLRGADLDGRLQQAKEAVRTRPSVAAWLELADAYRAVGRDDQYGATLREAFERFQEDTTVLMQMGELRYRRFLESLATPDGKAALELYQRAIHADRDNLKARFQFAELLYRIGAVRSAAAQLEKLVTIAPEHDRAARLLLAIGELKAVPGESKAKPSAEPSIDASEDLLSLFARVEERMELPNARLPWEPVTSSPITPSSTTDDPSTEVERLANESLAKQVVYFDPSGGMHARRCEPELADGVHRISEACQRAARGMELGTPSRFTIECEGGSLVLEMKRGCAIGLLMPAKAPLEGAATSARDSLERMSRGA